MSTAKGSLIKLILTVAQIGNITYQLRFLVSERNQRLAPKSYICLYTPIELFQHLPSISRDSFLKLPTTDLYLLEKHRKGRPGEAGEICPRNEF